MLCACVRIELMNKTSEHTTQGGSGTPVRKPEGASAPDPLPTYGWKPVQFDSVDATSASEGAGSFGVNKHKNVREYSVGEEVANAITHGIGAAFAVAAIPITVVLAVKHGGGILIAAALIYSISMLLEYTASTLYHALTARSAKKVFKVLDPAASYLFIAGSYTPYCLITLADAHGALLCVGVWALALFGVIIEAFWVFRPRWVSAVIYLALGWCVIWYLPPLLANLATPGLILLVAGGICYSIGCIFYVLKQIPYMHSVFHVWVLAGSILQFLSIVLYVL